MGSNDAVQLQHSTWKTAPRQSTWQNGLRRQIFLQQTCPFQNMIGSLSRKLTAIVLLLLLSSLVSLLVFVTAAAPVSAALPLRSVVLLSRRR